MKEKFFSKKRNISGENNEEQGKFIKCSFNMRFKNRMFIPGNQEQAGRFIAGRRMGGMNPVGINLGGMMQPFKRQDQSPIVLSNAKFTSTSPTVSWRERIVNKSTSAITKHIPITPAIAALQDGNSSQSDEDDSPKTKRAVKDKIIKKKS